MEISLAAAVAAVRDELVAAASQGAGAEVRFAVGEITLEFEVVLREDTSSKVGFSPWVVTGERSRMKENADTHRVSLKLTPRTSSGGDVWVEGAQDRAEGPGAVDGRLGR